MAFWNQAENKENYTTILTGIDLGYGQVKILSGEKAAKFLSVVGTPISDFGRETTVTNEQELLDSLAISFKGQKYYIGHNAVINTRNGRLSLRQNKAQTEHNKIKFITALALLTNQNQNNATFDIVTGLPVLEYKGQKDELYEMMFNYGNPFEFTMHYGQNDVKKSLKVKNVKVISQGEGSFYDFILDENGNTINDRAGLVSGQVMVVDPGYRTTDIVTMENGSYVEPMSDQLNKGVNQIHQEVLRLIMEKLNIKLELNDMDKVIRTRKLYYGKNEYDITNIINEAVKPFAEDIVDNLINITNEKLPFMQRIILTGGGAELIGPYMHILLKDTIEVSTLENAEFSNVNGYYKYGLLLRGAGML